MKTKPGDTELRDTNLEEYANYKYFYAGGSARFMFSHTVAFLKEELNGRCRVQPLVI